MSSENKVEDKVKVLADDEGNDGLEMVGDDGIVSDLPLTDLAENGNGHIGELCLGAPKAEAKAEGGNFCFQICLRLRWRGRTRRADWSTGSPLPGTNSRAAPGSRQEDRRRPRRRKETGGGP